MSRRTWLFTSTISTRRSKSMVMSDFPLLSFFFFLIFNCRPLSHIYGLYVIMSGLEKKKSWRHRCRLCSRNSGRYWRYWHSRHWNTKGKLGLFSRMFSLPLMLYGKCSLSPFMISPWYVCMYIVRVFFFLYYVWSFEIILFVFICETMDAI